MVELQQAITRIRLCVIFNVIATLIGIVVFVQGYIFPFDLGLSAVVLYSALYGPWVLVAIIAIFFQYWGAISLLLGCIEKDPPRKRILKAASILIIVDPIFNFISVIGMLIVPRMFIKGNTVRFWIAALILFLIAQLGGLTEGLLSIPMFLDYLPHSPFLPSHQPAFLEAMYWPLVIATLMSKAAMFSAWLTLFVSYRGLKIPEGLPQKASKGRKGSKS